MVPLTPKALKNPLKMLEPMKLIKLSKFDTFLDSLAKGMKIIHEFMLSFLHITFENSFLYISIFVEPFGDFSWIFTRIMGGEVIENVPKYVLYALYYSFKRDVLFN